MDNMTHMSMSHSFFVPDAEYVIDLEGLMMYLGEKISRGKILVNFLINLKKIVLNIENCILDFICIWCNDRGRTFYSLDAVQKHMSDKGHRKMLHEGLALAEYAEFYDYSSSYPDNVSALCHASIDDSSYVNRNYFIEIILR